MTRSEAHATVTIEVAGLRQTWGRLYFECQSRPLWISVHHVRGVASIHGQVCALGVPAWFVEREGLSPMEQAA